MSRLVLANVNLVDDSDGPRDSSLRVCALIFEDAHVTRTAASNQSQEDEVVDLAGAPVRLARRYGHRPAVEGGDLVSPELRSVEGSAGPLTMFIAGVRRATRMEAERNVGDADTDAPQAAEPLEGLTAGVSEHQPRDYTLGALIWRWPSAKLLNWPASG
jgi:hypothetical protein